MEYLVSEILMTCTDMISMFIRVFYSRKNMKRKNVALCDIFLIFREKQLFHVNLDEICTAGSSLFKFIFPEEDTV